MLASFFESYYRLRPVTATFTGVHDHDHRLPDWSPEGLASAADEMRGLRRSLAGAGTADASLHDVAERDRQLAIAFLDVQLAEDETAHFQRGNPSLALGEAVFGVIALVTRPFAPIAERAEAVVARLTAVPTFLDGARRSIAVPMPNEWRVKTLRELDGVERLLRDGLPRWIGVEHLGDAVALRITKAAERAGAAFEDFRRWVEGDGGSRDAFACGPDFFDLLLARGHSCERSVGSLLADARAALDEALARLDERARQVAPGGWPEVQSRLLDVHPTQDDYLSAYQRIWSACRERALDADLVTWPDAPIRYVPIPIHTRDAAPFLYYLHYRSPAPFDRLPIHDYVVTPIDGDLPSDEQRRRLRANNTSTITLNHVVHHGAIGHHVQNHHAYAGASEIGRVAAVDAACRIGMFLGGTLAEGWACYATDLMDEVEFLSPDQSLAQQHTRARLLARAIVDIGLHLRTLSAEAATALYRDRIGMSDEAARGEVCKNSMFPGTALMYWLGTDALHQLRRHRQRVEGASFSLRRFHDRVLSYGAIPVPLIEQLMS